MFSKKILLNLILDIYLLFLQLEILNLNNNRTVARRFAAYFQNTFS